MAAPELLPWVALRAGVLLSPLGRGNFEEELEDTLRSALKEFGRLLVWDLDGMERGSPQLDVYRKFEGKGLWVDAGVRNLDSLIDVLVAGAETAVINLRILPNHDLLGEATKLTDRLALCVEESATVLVKDFRDSGTRVESLFRQAAGIGIPRGVYLRDEGVTSEPGWTKSVEGMSIFSGPMRTVSPREPPEWKAIVDLRGMMERKS